MPGVFMYFTAMSVKKVSIFGATGSVGRSAAEVILSQPGGLNYGQAMAMATVLMVLATIGILLIERLRLPGAREF